MSAVFVDYDNIYLSLKRKNDEAARRFAKDAGLWLGEIASGRLITPTNSLSDIVQRRVVMCRCYGNPVPRRNNSDNSTDMNSFPFVRHHFLRAGFEAIDCPPLTAQLKNSADIRMVMDVRDLLTHDTYFDEFVILSGDADFTPVLHRLRAHARRTVIFANDNTAAPYTAIADGEVRESALMALLLDGRIASDAEPNNALPATPLRTSADLQSWGKDIIAEVVEAVRASGQPVPLEALADRAVRALGHERTAGSGWGGAGTFRELLARSLPGELRLSADPPYYVYDASRQIAAPPVQSTPPPLSAQPPVAREPAPVREAAPPPRELAAPREEPPRYEPRIEPPARVLTEAPVPTLVPAPPVAPAQLPTPPAALQPQPAPAVPARAAAPLNAAPAQPARTQFAPPAAPASAPTPVAYAPPAPATKPAQPAPRAIAQPTAPAPQAAAAESPQRAPAALPPRAAEGPTAMQQSIARIYEACQAPPLSPPEYRVLFEAMAQEITANGLTGSQTLVNIAQRAHEHGIEIRRDDVRFVLEVVSEADPWFEQGASTTLFATRFRNFVVARCRSHGLNLSLQELDLIDAWFVPPGAQRASVPAYAQRAPQAPAPAPQPAAAPARQQAQAASPPPYAQQIAAQQPAAPSSERWWSLDDARTQIGEVRQSSRLDDPDEFPRIVKNRLRG